MTPLTLETLQANLRRLAERLEYGADEDYSDDPLDFDSVACILYGLANGDSGDYIANGMELPESDIFYDEDEHSEED